MFFDIFGKMVWKDVCLFYAEVGMSYIQNMYFMHLQYKYNILEIYKTTIRKNYIKFCRYLRKVRYIRLLDFNLPVYKSIDKKCKAKSSEKVKKDALI